MLEESWHLRDPEGGLATPDFESGVQFKMCKQVLEKFVFMKDLGDFGVIEVSVEKMRCKLMAEKVEKVISSWSNVKLSYCTVHNFQTQPNLNF